MLDNRKIGELPEITGKMVKVRLWHAGSHTHTLNSRLEFFPSLWIHRASFAWCFMTADFSTRSTSSWKAGAGTGPEIASSTWVSTEGILLDLCVAVQPCMFINHAVVFGWIQFRILTDKLNCKCNVWMIFWRRRCALRTLLITACFTLIHCRYPHVRRHNRPQG